MSKKVKSTFSHFFKEDAENIESIIHEGANEPIPDIIGLAAKEIFPQIKASKEVSTDELKVQWQKLRSFFRNGDNRQALPAALRPVILSPMQTKTMLGVDYPLWIADEHFDGEGEHCLSFKEILAKAIHEIGPAEKEATILKNNMERIIHIANEQLKGKKAPFFQPALDHILDELEKQLEVSGEENQSFKNNLERLKIALPQNGSLLPLSVDTAFQLLEAAILTTHIPTEKKWKQAIHMLKSKLKDLLRIDRDKGPERKDPHQLQDALSFVDSLVKFDELSSILPEAGSELLGEEREQRIKRVLKDLEAADTILDKQGYLFIDHFLFENKNIDWEPLFKATTIEVFQKGEGCDSLTSAFEQHIATCTRLFAAQRIGELELENRYQAEVHDEYFSHFDWQSFTKEELNNCPHFILLIEDKQLFETEFNKLSKLLSDNIPVKIVAIKRADDEHYDQGSKKRANSLHTKAELGAVMLSYKNIFVAQSTSITPKSLFDSFKEGLTAFAPAFLHVLNFDEKTPANAFIQTSAAIESRDFPGFSYTGSLGTPWGGRFDISNNPQPSAGWPVHHLTILDEDGNKKDQAFPFTFAHQAVLNPAYHPYFLPVMSSCWSEDLIPLTEYLSGSPEEQIGKVPFIWMTDATNELHKVAVSWHMVVATQERLDFWRFLQENSGIHNYHVAQAVEQTKAEMKAVHGFEIEQLKKEQKLEIQKIREEEADKVMENLTSALLDLDASNVLSTNLPASTPPSPVSATSKTGETSSEEAPKAMEEEEIAFSNDPYIDTALCTSCNECINLNGAMFKYNADKMAYIADASAGTFKELVEAAEMCPVNIIHPGTPLNPNEPNLEDLTGRAEKFN